MPDVNSIDIQTEIQWYMRPYLLDFLIEAHAAFGLLPDTFFLAVNLLDRYCSRRVVYKRHYQLVGCAALLIAAKYGDKKDKVPTVRELRQMCCQLYDEDMFLQMEWHVLQTLNWMIGHPTVDSFLQLALQDTASEGDMELQHMTWYICELALFHKEFVPTRPSVLARSALALARCILNRPTARDINWAERYDSALVLSLANHLQQPSQVLFRKYSSMTFSAIAYTVESFLLAQQQQQNSAAEQAPVIVEPKYEPPVVGTPQTPQKHQYNAAIMQHGCWTPPETPDNDRFSQPGYTKPHFPAQAALPPTPSPTHSSQSTSSTMSDRYQYQTYFQSQHAQ
jgi:hypothetical protein